MRNRGGYGDLKQKKTTMWSYISEMLLYFLKGSSCTCFIAISKRSWEFRVLISCVCSLDTKDAERVSARIEPSCGL